MTCMYRLYKFIACYVDFSFSPASFENIEMRVQNCDG